MHCCIESFAVAAALAQSASEGAPEEEDLFLTRAALQFLAVGKPNNLDQKLEEVQELLQSYESIARHGLPDTPLIHFLKLLVKVRHSSCIFVSEPAILNLAVFLITSVVLWGPAVLTQLWSGNKCHLQDVTTMQLGILAVLKECTHVIDAKKQVSVAVSCMHHSSQQSGHATSPGSSCCCRL